MIIFLQQVISGLTYGSIISLIALGYTMVYGIVELINFAHGDLFMLGAFFMLMLIGGADLQSLSLFSGLLLILVVAIFTAFLNWGVHRWVYQPLLQSPRLTLLVSAIGVSFIFQNIGLLWGRIPMEVFGMGISAAAPKNVPSLISSENLLGETTLLRFTMKDLAVVLVTISLMTLLHLFVRYTRLGKAMRATAQDPIAAQLMGIDVNQVISTTFLIGGALAGAASVIYSLYVNTVSYQMGYTAGLYAFTAAVLGGIGNIRGAMVGGLVIGLVRYLGIQYIGAQWENAVVFSILIFILIFKPTGLLGTDLREKV